MIELTETMKRDLALLLREWREGRLGAPRPTGVVRRAPAPVPSRFGPLFQVTAVGGESCTVQRVDADGDPVAGTELTGVLFDLAPAVGAEALLARRTDGSLSLFQGGGKPVMLRAQEDMADAGPYECTYLAVGGEEGDTLDVYPPDGVPVNEGDTGFLGVDGAGHSVFIPCHARAIADLPLVVEVRDGSDPTSPENGQLWAREDVL